MALKDIQFFGKMDRMNREERISSEYPAWYHNRRMEMLKEEVETERFRLNNGKNAGTIPYETYNREMNLLALKEQRLKDIEASRPKLTGKDRDELKKVWDHVGGELRRVKPSKTEMMKGIANAHDQHKRNTEPCIQLEMNEGTPELCRNLGVPMSRDGKVTEKGADKMYKIIGRLLGENSDSESLRKRDDYGIFRADIPLKDLIAQAGK
jgi:hypothetical protein